MRTAKSFEHLVEVSAAQNIKYVRLFHLPPQGARYIARGKVIPQRMPCDFVGVESGTGRAIYFDAKSSVAERRFDLSLEHVALHQRTWLIDVGREGAISGLLVEARHPDLEMIYWIPWQLLAVPGVEWDDPRLLTLGPNDRLIDFGELMRRLNGPAEAA